MARLRRLIREVHHRSLWQVLGIYVVGAWLAYQVILGLTEGAILPAWFPGVAVGLFIVGLPIVLATAFVQEGAPVDRATPDGAAGPESRPGGVTPASEPRAPAGRRPEDRSARLTGVLTWRNAVGAGVAAFVFAGLVGVSAMYMGAGSGNGEAGARSVAVLPLENMSPDADDAFFADGIHEEIITQLARIQALRVIARPSVLEYRGTDKPLDQIAAELGVKHLLVGSVRRAGERVRITTQLLDPITSEPIWAESYEGAGADIFDIQLEVAEDIARALEARLTPGERSRLEVRPTESSEAYDLYLRARLLLDRGLDPADMGLGLGLLERALELDPAFAHAQAWLGIAHAQIYWFYIDHSPERREQARAAVDRALDLDPSLPEAHFALSQYLYWCELAYDEALREAEIARAGLPGAAEVPVLTGSIRRRQGRMEQAEHDFRRAQSLDPRSWLNTYTLAETNMLLRRAAEALAWADSTIRLGPELLDSWMIKGVVLLTVQGDTAGTRRLLEEVPEGVRPGEYSPELLRYRVASARRDHRVALTHIDALGTEAVANQFIYEPISLLAARSHALLGEGEQARAEYDVARRELEAALAASTDDVRMLSSLALALSGLGRHDEALATARRAYDLLPVEREAWRGAYRLEDLAEVQARAGRTDEAIANLETLLRRPSPTTVQRLRLEPRWDPLRGDPGFEALLDGA